MVNESQHRPAELAEAGRFRTTHWSLVLRAADSVDEASQQALERLCASYWPAVHTFICRRGFGPDVAQDLTQGFFARLLEKGWLKSVDASKGRFRTFLLTAVSRFVANECEREGAEKRGGGQALVSIDSMEADSSSIAPVHHGRTPEQEFDRRWAETLLDRVLARLRDEFDGGGRTGRFEELKAFLTDDRGERSYAEVGQRLGLSESAVKSGIYRLRQRYGELVRKEIADTVESPAEVEAEIRYLVSVLAT